MVICPQLPRFIHLPHIDDVGYRLLIIYISKLTPSHHPLSPTYVASPISSRQVEVISVRFNPRVAYLRKALLLNGLLVPCLCPLFIMIGRYSNRFIRVQRD
jgi:hypothetical protein